MLGAEVTCESLSRSRSRRQQNAADSRATERPGVAPELIPLRGWALGYALARCALPPYGPGWQERIYRQDYENAYDYDGKFGGSEFYVEEESDDDDDDDESHDAPAALGYPADHQLAVTSTPFQTRVQPKEADSQATTEPLLPDDAHGQHPSPESIKDSAP